MGTRPSKQLEERINSKARQLEAMLDSLRIAQLGTQIGYTTTFDSASGKITMQWLRRASEVPMQAELQFQDCSDSASLILESKHRGEFEPQWVPELWNLVEYLSFSKNGSRVVLGTTTLEDMQRLLLFLTQKFT
jgi:hypothetical protein